MFTRSLVAVVVTLSLSLSLQAQEKQKKVYRPDIPGFFMVDFGFNGAFNKPSNFVKGGWGSRTLNISYHYPVRIYNTKFSYNPGVGFAFERFKFTNGDTPVQQPNGEFT